MDPDLSGRHFLKLLDFTSDEIAYLVDLPDRSKKMKPSAACIPRRRSYMQR